MNAKTVPCCPYCHKPLDPIWDGKASCNSYACHLTRTPEGPPVGGDEPGSVSQTNTERE
jgi:hypothetical protein